MSCLLSKTAGANRLNLPAQTELRIQGRFLMTVHRKRGSGLSAP